MGRKGRKNCRVIGRTRDVRSNVATNALGKGPGDSMMLNEKMKRTASIRY